MRLALLLLLLVAFAPALFAVDRQGTSAEVSDRQFVLELFQNQENEFASEEIQAYQTRYPKGAFLDEMLYLQGRLAEREKDFAKAQKTYLQLAKSHPNSPYQAEGQYHQALATIGLGAYKKGVGQLKNFQQKYPKSPLDSWGVLGRAYVKLQAYPDAVKAFSFALQSKPKDIELLWEIAWAQEWAGQQTEAHIGFKGLLDQEISGPQKAKILYQMASDNLKNKMYPEAYQGFKEQWSLYPQKDLDLQSKFWCAETVVLWGEKAGEDREKEALWLLQQNQQSPAPIQPLASLRHQGMLQERLGNPGEALNLYQQLAASDPKVPSEVPLALHRAELAQALGQVDLALSILEHRPVGVVSRDLRLEAAVWTLLIHQKDCPGIIKRAAQNPVESEAGWYGLGVCQVDAGQDKQAVESLRHLSPSSPWERQASAVYLSVLEREKALAEALALADRGLTAGLEPPVLYLNAKIRLLRQTNRKEAVLWGEKTLEQKPHLLGESPFVLQLALAYGGEPRSPKRPLELLRIGQGQLSDPAQIQWVLEKRRALLLGAKDYQGLLGLFKEALVIEKAPEARLSLQLEIVKLKIQTGGAAPLKDLATLAQGKGYVAAQAAEILAETKISKKDYPGAAKDLKQGLTKKGTPELTQRLNYRLAQVYQANSQWELSLAEYQKVAAKKGPFRRQAKKQVKSIQGYLRDR